jgi:hypothetical protein
MTQGAVSRSQRSAAKRQRPPSAERRLGDEAFASGASAVGARHVGLGPGLVDEDKPVWIDRRLTRLPPLTPPGDVPPVLFGGAKAFFERHAFMLEKMPKRILADHKAAVGQLPEQSTQRRGGLLGDPRQNPIPLARHKIAHFQRGRIADGALAIPKRARVKFKPGGLWIGGQQGWLEPILWTFGSAWSRRASFVKPLPVLTMSPALTR